MVANPNPETTKIVPPNKHEPGDSCKNRNIYPSVFASWKGNFKDDLQRVVRFLNMNNMNKPQEHKLGIVIRKHSG